MRKGKEMARENVTESGRVVESERMSERESLRQEREKESNYEEEGVERERMRVGESM